LSAEYRLPLLAKTNIDALCSAVSLQQLSYCFLGASASLPTARRANRFHYIVNSTELYCDIFAARGLNWFSRAEFRALM